MTRRHVLAAALIVLAVLIVGRMQALDAVAAAPPADVLIAYDPADSHAAHFARGEWEPALQHMRIPHEWVELRDFAILDGAALARRVSAIAVPAALDPSTPDAARAQLAQFLRAGGMLIMARNVDDLRRAMRKKTAGV